MSTHAHQLSAQMQLFLAAGMQPLIAPGDPYLSAFSHKLGSAVFFGASLGVLNGLIAIAASFAPWLKGRFSLPDIAGYAVLAALFTFLGFSGEHPVVSVLVGIAAPACFFAPWALVIRRSGPRDLRIGRWLAMAAMVSSPLLFALTIGSASFEMIRDSMLTMPLTQDLSDFYYNHTLLAAHVIKPVEAQEQKVIAVSNAIRHIGPIPHGTLWIITKNPCAVEGRSLTVSRDELGCPSIVLPDGRPANAANRILTEYGKSFDENKWLRQGIGTFFYRGPFVLVPVFLMLWFSLFLSNLWERSPGGVVVVLGLYLALFWPAWKNFYEQYQLRAKPDAIARYILSEHEEMRYLALATFPEQFTDRELVRFSRDESPRIRVRTLFEAGKRGKARFLEIFERGLQDPQLNVRTRACMALGGIGSDRAADLLQQAMLQDSSWYVRAYAYRALGKMRPMARIVSDG